MQNLHIKIQIILLLAVSGALAQRHGHDGSPMPNNRKGMAAVVLDSSIWIIGGSEKMNSALRTVAKYDPLHDKWGANGPSMGHARDNPTAQVLDGKIYVFGGRDGHSVIDEVEMFDPQNGAWETVASMPMPRFSMASVVVDSSIWLIGGSLSNNNSSDQIDIYNPQNNEWRTLSAKLTIPRGNPTAAVFDHSVYVFGGFYYGPLGTFEKFDAESNTWIIEGDMLYAAASCAYAQSADAVWLIGGLGQSGSIAESQIFSWQSDTPWQTGPTLASEKYELASVFYQDKIYVFGGRGKSMGSTLDQVEIFEVSTGIENPEKPPAGFALAGNYPNPFLVSTTLSVHLPFPDEITFMVYDVLGRQVQRLHTGHLSAGYHTTPFLAYDANGLQLASGIYLVRVLGERTDQTFKMHVQR